MEDKIRYEQDYIAGLYQDEKLAQWQINQIIDFQISMLPDHATGTSSFTAETHNVQNPATRTLKLFN